MSDAIHDFAVDLIDAVGIFGVAVLMLVENLFPPIPSEIVLPLAGYSAYQGDLALVPAVLAATVGSTLGALALYAMGRYGGLPLCLRYQRVLRVSEEQIERADAWFDRHGDRIVFFSRMVPLVRSVVSIPAGMSEMPILRFTVLTFAGSAIWNALLIGLGYGLGHEWEAVSDVVGAASKVVLAAGVSGGLVWLVMRRRRRAATAT